MIGSTARSSMTSRSQYRKMSAGNPQYSEMELIASKVLTANQAGVLSFTNIPQDYKHLQIRAVMKSTYSGSENLYMRFNSTTYSFAGHYLFGNGSTVVSGNYTAANYADMMNIANAADVTNNFAAFIVDILDYTSTVKNKTIRGVFYVA